MQTKIRPFCIHNDTQDWVVVVGGQFGRFTTQAEAERVYRLIFGDDDIIDSTPFGSCELLDPGHKPRFPDDYEVDIVKVSEHAAIDIEQHIIGAWTRYKTRTPEQEARERRIAELPRLFDDE